MDWNLTEAKGLMYRSLRVLDVPSFAQMIRFTRLRRRFYDELWRTTAASIGAVYDDWEFGYGRISSDGMTTFVKLSDVMLDDHITLDIAGNKLLTYRLMRECGFDVPDHCGFTLATLGRAKHFLATADGPVVVKPARGTGGGRGVTTGITDVGALRRAARLATRFDARLMAEAQLDGRSHRLLYIGGDFVDAVVRDRPVVIGNGDSTIRQLVAAENAARLAGDPYLALSPLKIDRDARQFLRDRALDPASRPASGEVVELKRVANENSRNGNRSVRDDVHPDTIAAGAQLVRALGVQFAGLDLICKDISAPLGRGNGVISEVNTTPGIHHHYLVADNTPSVPVAALVLQYMFDHRRGVMHLGSGPLSPMDARLHQDAAE